MWDINKVSSKIGEFPLHYGSTGIYSHGGRGGGDFASEGGYDEMASTKLLAYDSDGNHMLCCSPSGLMIYKVIFFLKPLTRNLNIFLEILKRRILFGRFGCLIEFLLRFRLEI